MKDLTDFTAQVDYVMSQIDPLTSPSERTLFDWFYKVGQEIGGIKRIINNIRDADSDTEEERKLKTMAHLRKAIRKEILHHQVQRNDAATKDGTVNAPFAISDAKAKAEEAKQEKTKKKWLQPNSNKEPPPRAGLAAAAVDGQVGDDAVPPPPPAYGAPNSKGGHGGKAWQDQWLEKGWKGGKNKKGEKSKGESKGGKKGRDKRTMACFAKMNKRCLRKPRLPVQS